MLLCNTFGMAIDTFAIPARSAYLKGNGEELFELYSIRNMDSTEVRGEGAISIGNRVFRRYIVERGYLESTLPEEYLQNFRFSKIRKQKIPRIMAIVNSTPDSFYPGSRHKNASEKLDEIMKSLPDIIDIGGESTRPGSIPVAESEEIGRITPIMDHVTSNCSIPISLDTRHPQVALHFIDSISIINDIGGFTNPEMVKICLEYGKDCIVMHMRGTPADMQKFTQYDDVVAEVSYFLQSQVAALVNAGVSRERIIVDPGIGFSKDFKGNLSLLKNVDSLRFGYPILVGHSRKGFIGAVTGRPVEERLAGTLSVSAYLAQHGADIVRVHDPAQNRDAMLMMMAMEEAD